MEIALLIIVVVLILFFKIFLGIWVYKDAKSRGIDPLIWTILILFFSGSFMFLLYFLVVRKDIKVKCESCNFTQSDKLLYCGRCGSEIKINQDHKELKDSSNKLYLYISIILLIIAIIFGAVFTFKTVYKDRNSIPITLMSMKSKYSSKWKEKFKYKNGKESNTFKIKEKTILNASWDIDDGYIEAKLYSDDILIREIYSEDVPNYEELIDLSEYKDSKVVLKLNFFKTSGKIEFILE